MNVSSKILTEKEEQLLGKGLNFATVHSKQDELKFLANIETGIKQIKGITNQDKDELRLKVTNAVKNAPKTSNLNHDEQQTLKQLKSDKSICIVPADKGRVTVVLDNALYIVKCESHLSNENIYKKVNRNPTKSLKTKINNHIKDLKDRQLLPEKLYKRLYSSTAATPMFYGLIKTHKEGLPIRPIVSFINSPSYNLAQYISQILTPLTNLAPQKLKNSYQAREELSQKVIPLDHRLVSFDVVSLFTSIPHSLALQCTHDALVDYDDFINHSRLSISEFLELIQLCISSNTFLYNGQLYQQISGLPMGSPASVVLCEITMQFIERRIEAEAPHRPLFWYRYVDDCLTVLKLAEVENFLQFLNSLNINIQFTLELERDNEISFLDIKIKINNEDRTLSFDVYRKPTNSGKFLDFNSYHHTTHKRNVILSMKNRAIKICSEESLANENIKIKQQLRNNGYPDSFISKTKLNQDHQINSVPNITFVSTPYIKGASEKIGKLLRRFDIKLSNKSTNTLRRHLCHLKDRKNKLSSSQVIYQVKCIDCNMTYTGETGRELEVRITEHRRNIRLRDNNSLIYQHLEQTGHTDMDWDNIKILATATRTDERLFLESCYTLTDDNNFNRCLDLPDQYKSTVRRIIQDD